MNLEEDAAHFSLRILCKFIQLMDKNIFYCRLKGIRNES